jgi:metallo-beta-lactamase family protein
MTATLQSYGAAGEVTGSKHLFRVNERQILVDCGMFQGHRADTYQRNQTFGFAPAELDAMLLTHGHFDHCGNTPSLVLAGFDGSVHATSATRDIANLVLLDSAHIMAKDYEFLCRKRPEPCPFKPLFDERAVLRTMDHFVTLGYRRRFSLPGDVECEFYNSGHILGSAVAVCSFGSGAAARRIAFTGDLGRRGMPIIPEPEPLPPVDYLVCEGTYGNRRHDPLEDAQRQLGQVVNETVARKGKLIIPSFAIGRTQELVFFLHLLKDAKQIPDVDIFVDGPMAVNATSIFRVHPECYGESVRQAFIDHHRNPFGFEGLRYVTDVEESKRLNERTEPCIIISGSGMCEGGRILHHLKNNIGDPRNTVLIVGFMAEHTLGRAVADRRPEVKIFGEAYPLKARVKILNTFSGHADYEDLRAYVGGMDLKRLRRVFLVHGEPDALANLRDILLGAGVRDVEIVAYDRQYELA